MVTERIAKSEPKKNMDLRNTCTFRIEKTLPTGEEFSGTFTIHRPTIGERINIGILEAQRLVGMANVDMYTGGLVHMVATLETIIDDAPVWWKPQEMRDVEVVTEVYNKYIDFLNTFQGKPKLESGSGENS